MENINLISQAYSQQPTTICVMSEKHYAQAKHNKANICKEIKIEQIHTGCGDVFMAYVGYNFEGKKIFQYKFDAMNVEYGEPYPFL